MDLVLDLLATVSRWSRSNLSEISLALVGCLLVLFGADIKGWIEGRLGSIAGALRVPLMALVCMIASWVWWPKFVRLLSLSSELNGVKLNGVRPHYFNVEWFRGIGEYKIDWGPGYRIYLAKDGLKIIILLGGGSKKRQQKDIDQALAMWEDYKRRKSQTLKGM